MDTRGANGNSRRRRWSIASKTCTPGRWCALAALFLALPASAQTLNLDGPPPPEPGTSLYALEITSRMQRAAERFEADAASRGDVASEAKRQLRLAAASLAELGDRAGTDGSHLVLAAMTLERRLGSLDELVENATDPLLVPALASDLDRVRLEWERGGELSPDQLDRDLRYVFAQAALLERISPEGVGWFEPERSSGDVALADLIPALAEAGVGDEDLSRVRELVERFSLMDEWPGFVREARSRRHLIGTAADVVTSPPVWLSAEARERQARDFADAITSEDPDTQRTLLQLIGAQGEVMRLLTDLGEGRSADRLRSRASQSVERREGEAQAALDATRLAAHVLTTSIEMGRVQQDESLLRQIRPAWRALVPEVRNIVVSAQDAAVNLMFDPTRRTDPGELTAISALNRIADDFRSLERFSERFAPGEGERNKANDAIAERLLALGQDMTDGDDERQTALRLFRELDAQLDDWDDIDRLRESASRVVGDRQGELDDRVGVLLDQWLAGWGTPGGFGAGEEVVLDLRLTRDILRTFADVSAFTDLGAIESWPGFEISTDSRNLVTNGLTPAIDTLTSELIRGPSAISRERAQRTHISLRGTHGPALLVGRLARLGGESGLRVGGPLDELALGPPTPDSWMHAYRDALADISWAAEELGRQLESDPDASDERTQLVHAHLRWRALRTLEAIEREQRQN